MQNAFFFHKPFIRIDLGDSLWQPNRAMKGKKKEKPSSLLADLRAELQRYRIANDLTHAQVGELIGVTRGPIQAFEAGKSMPRPEEFEKLYALLRSAPLAFADDLQGVVNVLRAPGMTDDAKMAYLIDRVKALHTALESRGAAVDKPVK